MIKFSRTHYFGNDTGIACKIGDVFQKSGSDFIFLSNIFDDIVGLDREGNINRSNPMNFVLTSESGVSVDLEAKAGVPLEKTEARIRFSNRHSAFVYLKSAVTYSLAIARIQKKLYKYWTDMGYIRDVNNYCLINTLLEASSGKIIFSKCNKTSVTLGHSGGMPLNTLEGIADAQVKITGEASSIGSIDTVNINQPVVQMIRWYKKWSRNKFRLM
jgi:hypothetical protein